MKGLCSSAFRGIYLYFGSNWLQAAENWHEFETALPIHFFFIFFFIHCVLLRSLFITSANTRRVCKSKFSRLTGIIWARFRSPMHTMCTHESTPAVPGSSLLKCHLYFKVELNKKMRVRFTACQLLLSNCPCYPSGNLPEYLREQLPCRKSRPSPLLTFFM